MKYEKNVYQRLIKYFIKVFVAISILLIGLYYFVFMEVEKNQVYGELLALDKSLDQILKENQRFFSENIGEIEDFIDGEDKAFIEKAYAYKNKEGINSSFLAFDKDYTLTNIFSMNDKLKRDNIKYIEIRLRSFESGKYYSYGKYADDKKIIYIKAYSNGFLILQVRDSQVNKILNKDSKDYILTNKFGRIISKGSNIKYYGEKLDLDKYKDGYISYEDKKGDFHLYVIHEKFFKRDLILMILAGLSLISFIYILVISSLTQKISKEISLSLNNLIKEIGLVSAGKIKKLNIDADDETKYISENINTLIESVKKLEANNTALKYEKKASDVKTMESQFNPHFLYNTLDIISYQMYVDRDSCQKLISKLSKILRYSINNMSFVYLEEDLEYIKMYMDIQEVKHGNALDISYNIDQSLKAIMVPKLFIQPILENSLKYGFINRKCLKISIDIYKKDSKIYIDIRDSGKPLSLVEMARLNRLIDQKSVNSFLTDDHHGLENTLKRLRVLYKDARLEFYEDENVLVRISFRGKNESIDS